MVTDTYERTARKLLLALQAVEPSWRVETYPVHANPLDPKSPPVETLSLCQGGRRFCRGLDLSGMLLDFVECCRDRGYSVENGWRIPGMLRDAVDVDDLSFRLEVLT